MTTDSSQPKRQNALVLPWGWLSLGLTTVTIAALGTLAVVAKKQGADTLSTIALALAILSFAAQLIVALAQAYNGTLQVSQAGQVNADTRSSLAEIRATSQALLSNQREQFSEVLRAALKVAVPAAVQDVETAQAGGGDEGINGESAHESSQDLEDRLIVRLNEALSQAGTPSNTLLAVDRSPTRLYGRITTYPDEDRGRELLAILKALTPQEAAIFGRLATRVMERAQRGEPARLAVKTSGLKEAMKKLQERGLIRLRERPIEDDSMRHYWLDLTDLGVGLASLILGRGREPEWLLS
jgi:hypothetical protein